MFWKKNRKITIQDLGEFELIVDTWYCESKFRDKELHIGLEGTKEEPDTDAVRNARMLLENIDPYLKQAEDYLKNKDISEFTKNSGEIYFSSFFCKKNIDEFDIEFSLTEWEEAYILVHFKNKIPYELSLGD
jgi:hypothetical protein